MATLVGIDAKFNRAVQEGEVLRRDARQFAQAQQQFIAHEVHEDAGEQVWVFRGETPSTPVEWSIRLGEIIYNLRSALDHLIWQLVLSNGQTPSGDNAFPVTRSHSQFQNQAKSLLKGVAPAPAAIIESLQPRPGRDSTLNNLWRLHRLNNIDKHRHLNMTIASVIRGRVSSFDNRFGSLIASGDIFSNIGPLQKDAVILTVRDAQMEVEANLAVEIRFSEVEPQVTNLALGNTISTTRYIVDRAIQSLRSYVI